MLSTHPLRRRRRPLPINSDNGNDLTVKNKSPAPENEAIRLSQWDRIGRAKEGQNSVLSKLLEETPPRLRELEEGWRDRRRKVVEEVPYGRTGSGAADSQAIERELVNQRIQKRSLPRSAGLEAKRTGTASKHHGIHRQIYDGAMKKTNVRFESSSPSVLPTPPNTPPLSAPIYSRRRTGMAFQDPEPRRSTGSSSPSRLAATLPDVTTNVPQPFRQHFFPIQADPLPPTSRPIPLQRNGKDTIHIPTSNNEVELILGLANGRMVQVLEGGEQIKLMGNLATRTRREKILRLDESDSWGKSEKRDWQVVQRIVEDFKRRTPRVKIFGALGHLTVTCSSPADIILSFNINLASQTKTPPDQTPGTSSDRLSLKPHGHYGIAKGRKVNVRLMYSRIASELRIDTSYIETGSGDPSRPPDRLRTKRMVSIWVDGSIAPEDSLMVLRDAATSLGVREGSCRWLDEEREGMRRLWELRKDWTRWDAG